MRDDPWLASRIDDLSLDLGKLRRLTIGTTWEYRVERICNEVWTLLAEFRPTAGERVREGMDVDEALKVTDAETRQMLWMLGLDRAVLPHLD